ncbi:MAG: DUF1376 domain-containing protein [Hyphomicrobiales bacterium]|nr:DUF1376 domain-containing protein [Hyphomicrobiales bacterium]
MSSKYPFLPLSVDAYLCDTRHLSLEEHGAYLLLLMVAWNRPQCNLPDDDKYLSRVLGITADEWLKLKPTIMDFWTYDGRSRTWIQKRLKKENDYVHVKKRKRQDSAANRWNKTKNNDANGYASPPPPPQKIDRIEGEKPTESEKEKKGPFGVVDGGLS